VKARYAIVVIVANSPGEVEGWARPLVASLRASEARAAEEFGKLKIVIALTPCPFASGREAEVAAGLPGVDVVVTPSQYVRCVVLGLIPAKMRGLSAEDAGGPWRGIVVHLGGDHLHSALIARRLGFPAVAYSDRTAGFASSFVRFMAEDARVREKLERKGVPAGRIEVVGNLMIDGVRPAEARGKTRVALGLADDADDAPLVCLLPGSRKQQIRHVMPFFLRVAEIVKRFREDARFVMALSPFVGIDTVERFLSMGSDLGRERADESGGRQGLEGASGRLSAVEGSPATHIIETDEGVSVLVVSEARHDAMAASEVAVSMPGTVTAELAYLGVPTVVAVPLNLPHEVPLTGVVDMLGRIPVIGRPIRRAGVRKALARIEFTAIPNKRQKRMIVPEVRGVLSAEDVAIKVLELLQDKKARDRIAVELRQAMGQPGAADRVASIVLDTLISTGGRRS